MVGKRGKRRIGTAVLLCCCFLAAAAPGAPAADPGRWSETGRSTIPLYYYQGVSSDPQVNLYFDGIYSGLYRTDSQLRKTARNDDVIPPAVRLSEGYNHIGDITWDAAEGGRILLPLECYYPGTPNGGNSCGTGSIGVADPATLQWRYYVKLDARDIAKAMWAEVSPDGDELWTSSGRDLLVYRLADIKAANAAPAGPKLRPVRRLSRAVPASGITGATFYEDGRLYVAGQGAGPFQVWSIDVATGANRLEIERQIVGESEGLDVFSALGGVLHWQIQPYNEEAVPTYGPANGTLLHFVPVPPSVPDADADGVEDGRDNCRGLPNADQADADGDGQGDVCDPDDDNDSAPDAADNCPRVPNDDQANSDADSDGDACDADDDNDGIADAGDRCPVKAGGGTSDGCPVVAPSDSDSDGRADGDDNCPDRANADQADVDRDGAGDVCDADDDGDTVPDTVDNCRALANQDQANSDADAEGDACDPDDDNDGVADAGDNCRPTANADQADGDRDGQGDACDVDDDNDGVLDSADRCPLQPAADSGDGCPPSHGDPPPDRDRDRISDAIELGRGTFVLDRDSDDDGLSDSREDRDRDGRLDRLETDPLRWDSDRDLLSDGVERGKTRPIGDPPGPVRGTRRARFRRDRDPRTHTNARARDTDGDRLRDATEDRNRNGRREARETDARRSDSDGDGLLDGRDARPLARSS